MTARYLLSKKVICLTLRMPKEHSGYFIHLLESCDNLAFPTTLEHPPGVGWRDVLVRAPIEWQGELRRLIQKFQEEVPVSIIEDREVCDD